MCQANCIRSCGNNHAGCRRDELPKTILYSLNPNDNQAIGTILGCFQDSSAVAKIQQGSAWWFNDHKTGMQDQMISLANLGNLSGQKRSTPWRRRNPSVHKEPCTDLQRCGCERLILVTMLSDTGAWGKRSETRFSTGPI